MKARHDLPSGTRIAAVDFGTNALDALVAEATADGFRTVAAAKDWIDLGRHGFSEDLGPLVHERALAALGRIRIFCDHHRVEEVVVAATSALREADDCQQLVEEAARQFGLDIELLDPLEETRLIATAISRQAAPSEPAWIADLGGGNLSLGRLEGRGGAQALGSLELGTARLLGDLPIPSEEPLPLSLEEKIRARVALELDDVELHQEDPADLLVGTAGTAATVVRLAGATGRHQVVGEIDSRDLRALLRKILGMSRTQRLKLPFLDYRRVDQIVPGAIVFDELMHRLGTPRLRAIKPSLREGLMIRRLGLETVSTHRRFRLPATPAAPGLPEPLDLEAGEPPSSELQAS